jgi:outer membrane protein assembly factor BamB
VLRRRVIIAFIAFGLILAGCGGGSNSVPVPRESSPPPKALNDNWSSFAGDYADRGDGAAAATVLTSQNVGKLQLRWTRALNEAAYSSPVIYNGTLIFVTHTTGTVYALDSTTGNILWSKTLGGQVRMTPTIADGMVFVGTHLFTSPSPGVYYPAPSDLYALDLKTGTQVWKAHVGGTIRASVVVANGKVFAGIAGGDGPTCLHGGVVAVDEFTGAPVWSWYVDPNSGKGGSVWSPLAYDGSHLIFGTGNTCEGPVSTANGVVALNLNGTLAWNLVSANSLTDDDTGGGATLHNGTAYIINKNGTLYAINEYTGSLQWTKYLGASDGNGGIATPSTDGSTIFIATGTPAASPKAVTAAEKFFRRPMTNVPTGSPQGALYALDMMGGVKWSVQSQAKMASYVTIVGNIAFADIDDKIEALDVATGQVLWSHSAGALINAGPVVVPSGVYTVDSNGNIYAFGLPKS